MSRYRLSDLNTTCGQCGGVVPYWGDSCSRCGRLAHPRGRLRAWGAVYLVLGLGLTGVMLYLMLLIGNFNSHSGDPRATVRFNGGPAQILMVYGILSFPLLVGVTLLAGGIWQLRYGRRNLKVVRVAMFWYALLMGGAFIIRVIQLFRTRWH